MPTVIGAFALVLARPFLAKAYVIGGVFVPPSLPSFGEVVSNGVPVSNGMVAGAVDEAIA